MAEGEDVGAFALSEPGAGSGVPAVETTVRPVRGAGGDAHDSGDRGDGDRDGHDRDTVGSDRTDDPDADGRDISSFVVRPENRQAARYLMHAAADRKMRGDSYVKAAAQAKLFASEMSREVRSEAIQIHGGYGYTTDFAVELECPTASKRMGAVGSLSKPFSNLILYQPPIYCWVYNSRTWAVGGWVRVQAVVSPNGLAVVQPVRLTGPQVASEG